MGYNSAVAQLLQDANSKKIVVIGEPIVDVFIHGTMATIAPVSPVPHLIIRRENALPGAAAAVARMLATVGAQVSFAGVAGDDHAGLLLRSKLASAGVDTNLIIVDSESPTRVITHVLGEDSINGRPLLRMERRASERIIPSARQALTAIVTEALDDADIFVFVTDAEETYPEVFVQLRDAAKHRTTRIVEIALCDVASPLENTLNSDKLYTLPELQWLVQQVRDRGGNIVFTNGCFDILHAGHVKYLAAASQQGDFFVVALNSDESVRAIKGPNRPVQNEQARATVLSSLECIDALVLFSTADVRSLIDVLRPEVYVKGGDYTIETINQPERRLVEAYGGQIVLLPGVEGQSTTNILRKIHEDGLR